MLEVIYQCEPSRHVVIVYDEKGSERGRGEGEKEGGRGRERVNGRREKNLFLINIVVTYVYS